MLQVAECTAEVVARHRMTQALALAGPLLLAAPHRTTRKAVTSSSSSAQMVSYVVVCRVGLCAHNDVC